MHVGWGLPTQSVRQHCMNPRASAIATADWCWNVFCVCSPRCDQRCDSTLTLTLPKAVFISERIFLPKTYPKVANRLHFRIVLPRFRPNSSKVALKPWIKDTIYLYHKQVYHREAPNSVDIRFWPQAPKMPPHAPNLSTGLPRIVCLASFGRTRARKQTNKHTNKQRHQNPPET